MRFGLSRQIPSLSTSSKYLSLTTTLSSSSFLFSSSRIMSTASTPRKKMYMQTSAPMADRKPHIVKFGKVPGLGTKEHPLFIGDEKNNTLIDPPLELVDNLYHLRDDTRKNEKVLSLLRAENNFFEYKTDNLAVLEEKIYKEHIGHLKETDDTVPVRHGEFIYWTKTFEGKSYPVHVRAPVGTDLAKTVTTTKDKESDKETCQVNEEVAETLLDVNALAAGRVQCDVHAVKPDPRSHSVIAYSLDLVGEELYTIFFKRLRNYENQLSESIKQDKKIENTTGDILWLPNSDAVIYSTRDSAKRADKIWLHHLSSLDTKNDVLLFHEEDQLFSCSASLSRDGKYLFISTGSFDSDETLFCPLYKYNSEARRITKDCFKPVKERKFGHRYSVESWNAGHFIIVTDADGAKTNKIVYVNEEKLDDWSRVLVPCTSERTIDSVLAIKNGLVIDGRSEGLTQLWTVPVVESERSYNHQQNVTTAMTSVDFFNKCFGTTTDLTATLKMMQQPEPLYEVNLLYGPSKHFDSDIFRIQYSSMVTPTRWVEVNVTNADVDTKVLKQKEVPNYNPDDYCCERRWATAPDGVKVPMSILRKKTTTILSTDELKAVSGDVDYEPKQRHPCHAYFYGSYGICIDPAFKTTPFPLLDRGFVYCIGHVRGGGEMGRSWFEEQGKVLTKRNTFSDAIACLESLINEHKITTASTLSIEGRSAGGLLVGVLLNQRPDLFKCAVSGVGFCDLLTTESDPTIPLTVGEWQCVGNPHTWQHHDYMRSYCPMTNVRKQNYPNVLFTAGLHDPRVPFWEVAKFVQKLREHNTNKNSELIAKFEMESGHFSANDRYKWWKEVATYQAWLVKHLTGKLE